MKKKSLVAMGLAGVMTIGMCVPVLAADTDIYEEFDQNNPPTLTTVEMQVSPSYTVKIPTKLNVDSSTGTVSLNVAANNTVLHNGKVLEIAVPAQSIDLKLEGDDTTIYKMNFSGITGTGKWVLGTFETGLTTEDNLASASLTKADETKIVKAGKYSATVQFTVSEEDKVTTP